jgi:uncharacterized protein YgiM (DUF1202 family)
MKKICMLIVLAGITAVFSASGFTTGQKVYVTVNKLNVRSRPTLQGKLLGQFLLAEELTILKKGDKKEKVAGKNGYWYQVKGTTQTGWVFGTFLTVKKVSKKADLVKKLAGTYYYYELQRKNNYTRILKITAESYSERFYNTNSGITDEISGNVVFQADNIILLPKKRRVRPSAYIDYPQNASENAAYQNAYFQWTDDPAYLKKLSRFKPAKKSIKLFVKYDAANKMYLLEKDTAIEKMKYGYTR